jgi:hypothetical protein
VTDKCEKQFETTKDVFTFFLTCDKETRFAVWKDLAARLNIDAKKMHDFFHNTWSKQYYDNMDPFRMQMRKYMEQTTNLNEDSTQTVTLRIQQQYPNYQFHYQTLYQFVNYALKVMRNEEPSDGAPGFRPQGSAAYISNDEGVVINVSILKDVLKKLER